MGRPAARQARETRREILDAALDLFAAHGFHGAGIRAIAAAASVRESALYHYFPSKAALWDALVTEGAAEHAAGWEAALAPLLAGPLEPIVEALVTRTLAAASSPREARFVRLLVTTGASAPGGEGQPAWRVLTDERRRLVGRVLGALKRRGVVREDLDPELFHLQLAAPILVATNALFGEGEAPLSMPMPRFVRQHVAFLVRAASAGGESSGARAPRTRVGAGPRAEKNLTNVRKASPKRRR